MANLSVATPPWLSTQPSEFSGALLRGFQTGLSLADMENKIAESNAQRVEAAQRQADANALAVWEREQQMALDREKLAQEAQSSLAQQQALDAYRKGELGLRQAANVIDEARAKETGRHNLVEENRLINVGGVLYDRNGVALTEPTSRLPVEFQRKPGTDYVTAGGAVISAKETPQEIATRKVLERESDSIQKQLLSAQKATLDPAIDPVTKGALLTNTIPTLQRQYAERTRALTNAPVANPASSTIVTPQTQEQFDRLPSGAIFINPADGKRYRKN